MSPKSSLSHDASLHRASSAWSTPLSVATDGLANVNIGPGISQPMSATATTTFSSVVQPPRRPLMVSNANVVPVARGRPQIIAGPHAHQQARAQLQAQVQAQAQAYTQTTALNQGKHVGMSVVDFTNRDVARTFPTLPAHFTRINDLGGLTRGPVSAPLTRSSPPASNEAAQTTALRGDVGAIGDGRKRLQSEFEQEMSPRVEAEQTAALLRSLNLTPPSLPPSGPVLSLNTNLGTFGQYPSSMDSFLLRRSMFDPFLGGYSTGTPASLSPTTPDQGEVFDPSIRGEHLIHQNPHAMFKMPSLDDLRSEGEPPSSIVSTAPSTTNTTPTKNNNYSNTASAPSIVDPRTVGSSEAFVTEYGLPSPPSNSNSDGSGDDTTTSGLSNIPIVLSPPTHVGNFQFQAPAPYLRSPSPYWRYLPEYEPYLRHHPYASTGRSIEAMNASHEGTGLNPTGADGWVPSVPTDVGPSYQENAHVIHRPTAMNAGVASPWGHRANGTVNFLSPSAMHSNNTSFNDILSAPSPQSAPSPLPSGAITFLTGTPNSSLQATMGDVDMSLSLSSSMGSWSNVASFSSMMKGLGIASGSGHALPTNIPDEAPMASIPNGTLPNNVPVFSSSFSTNRTDDVSSFKPGSLSSYAGSLMKGTPASRDGGFWQARDTQAIGELGHPGQRGVFTPSGLMPTGSLGRSSIAPQRFTTSRVDDDENLNFLQLLQPNAKPPYHVLVHRIVKKSDQQASIFIQQKLKNASVEERSRIVCAIVERGLEMMQGRFGNWCVQRCLEAPCEREDRMKIVECMAGHVVELATNCYGTHVVQKALECEEDIKRIIVAELLDNDPAYTLTSKHCSHVWAKVMELSWHEGPPPPIFSVVNHSLRGKWASLACHETGSLVVQTMFENMDDAGDKRVIVDEILDNLDEVVKNQWGAFVVQHIIEHGDVDVSHRTSLSLIANMAVYGTHDVAVKSVLKILKEKDPLMLDAAISKMCEVNSSVHRNKRPIIVDLALSANGSQIIQAVLPEANKDQRTRLYDAVKGHTVTLRGCKTGSRVIWLFDRMASGFE